MNGEARSRYAVFLRAAGEESEPHSERQKERRQSTDDRSRDRERVQAEGYFDAVEHLLKVGGV